MMSSPSYHNNPYAHKVIDYSRASRSPSPGPEPHHIEQGTLHTSLVGTVNFMPYPATVQAPSFIPPKSELVRLFIGQLPYDTTSIQAEWIVFACTGVQTYYTERIHSWKAGHQSKGCVHTFCRPEDVRLVIYQMHHAVLVDDTGIWFAADEEQFHALQAYCVAMKADKSLRFKNRPYQPLVAEEADSTFIPREKPQSPPYFATSSPSCAAQHATPPPQYFESAMMPPSYSETIQLFSHDENVERQ